MKTLLVLVFIQTLMIHSSQASESFDQKKGASSESSQSVIKLQELLKEKFRSSSSNSEEDLKTSDRKSKALNFYPYQLPQILPYGLPPGLYYPQDKEGSEGAYPTDWLSRTEPFKKNTALLDSPTYYIRLPPNPYVYVPGMGYVSRPPSLSDPEVMEGNKVQRPPETGNEIFDDPFYRLPIKFVSNGKPVSVYQLPNGQTIPKPESNLINLNKGPYVFNGKPGEIYLLAQIYNALYGDELNHFYP